MQAAVFRRLTPGAHWVDILGVDGHWKLADLDSCTKRGEPAIRHPIDDRYVHPDREHGVPARDEFDVYGLEQVLRVARRDRTRLR